MHGSVQPRPPSNAYAMIPHRALRSTLTDDAAKASLVCIRKATLSLSYMPNYRYGVSATYARFVHCNKHALERLVVKALLFRKQSLLFLCTRAFNACRQQSNGAVAPSTKASCDTFAKPLRTVRVHDDAQSAWAGTKERKTTLSGAAHCVPIYVKWYRNYLASAHSLD